MNKNKPQLSANTLFHYTNSIKHLINILTNEFYPRYCLEEGMNLIFSQDSIEIAIPMVCFCDIPLSQVEQHAKFYGSYAIGLSKEWGKIHKISPVMYSYKDAASAEYIYNLWQGYLDKTDEGIGNIDDLMPFCYFLKPYEGQIWKDGKKRKRLKIFYDEREWRYVPLITKDNHPMGIRGQWIKNTMYLDKEIRKELNGYLETDELKLKFTPNDIKYIIVKNESERKEIRDQIIRIKSTKFAPRDIEILTTRILTVEQIMEDF